MVFLTGDLLLLADVYYTASQLLLACIRRFNFDAWRCQGSHWFPCPSVFPRASRRPPLLSITYRRAVKVPRAPLGLILINRSTYREVSYTLLNVVFWLACISLAVIMKALRKLITLSFRWPRLSIAKSFGLEKR